MFGLLRRQMCFWVYFIVTIPAWMSVYVTSPEAVWALRPRGKPPPCMPQLHARLVSFDLWTATRLIHTTAGWRPVPRRGCRAGRHVSKQRVTSVSVSSLPSRRERQIPVIVGRRLLADRPPTTPTSVIVGRQQHDVVAATRHRRRLVSRFCVPFRSVVERRNKSLMPCDVRRRMSVSAVVVPAECCGVDEAARYRAACLRPAQLQR